MGRDATWVRNRLALEELQQTAQPAACAEQMVNGKLMEVKGKLLQMGVHDDGHQHVLLGEPTGRPRRRSRRSTQLGQPPKQQQGRRGQPRSRPWRVM